MQAYLLEIFTQEDDMDRLNNEGKFRSCLYFPNVGVIHFKDGFCIDPATQHPATAYNVDWCSSEPHAISQLEGFLADALGSSSSPRKTKYVAVIDLPEEPVRALLQAATKYKEAKKSFEGAGNSLSQILKKLGGVVHALNQEQAT